ncbi:MAG: hypothetical protein IKA05_06550 [Clostridia bacterium]|nr:hypothetical protein [Clostridia bacterium]
MYGYNPIMLLASGETLWEKLTAWYQNSLLCELLDYLVNTYFSVEFGAYDHIVLGGNANATARNAILAAMFGVVLAAILTAYYRNGLGGFVRRLLKEEIHSPEAAKTLYELGYFRSAMIRKELSKGSALRMVVRCRELEEDAQKASASSKKPTKIDFTAAHFYIPEELRHRADIRFDKKGSGPLPVLLTAVVAIVVAAVLCRLLPDILQFADNLIHMLSP